MKLQSEETRPARVLVIAVAGLLLTGCAGAPEVHSETDRDAGGAPGKVDSSPVDSPEPVSDVDLCQESDRWFDFAYGLNDLALTRSELNGYGQDFELDEVTVAQVERHVREAQAIEDGAQSAELRAAAGAVVDYYTELVGGGVASKVPLDGMMEALTPGRDLSERCEVVLAESDLTGD